LGDWDVLSISYSISDVVLHGGIYYVCKDAHVSGAITEPGVGASWTDVWDVLDATFIGQDGISFIWQSQWLTATTYNANDVVYNNGSSYICILGHLSSATDEPGVGVNTATYWDLMTGATGLSNEVFATLADAAPVVWAASATAAHQNAKVTITATRVLSLTGWTSGMHGTLQVIQDGVGGWGVTLPAGSKVEGGGAGAVTLTAAAGSIDVLDVFYDGTNYFWSLKPNYT
jgi:hypothetical protein